MEPNGRGKNRKKKANDNLVRGNATRSCIKKRKGVNHLLEKKKSETFGHCSIPKENNNTDQINGRRPKK